MDSCSLPSGTFYSTGCEHARTLPSASADLAPGHTGSCGGTRGASQRALSCTTGCRGTAVATCSTAGRKHVLGGCAAEPVCTLPATTTTGSCGGTQSAAQCALSCTTGCQVTAVATCSTAGGTRVLGGSTAEPDCSLPAATTGHSPGSCAAAAASPLSKDPCSMSCATDCRGIGMATNSCSSSSGTFTLRDCELACTMESIAKKMDDFTTTTGNFKIIKEQMQKNSVTGNKTKYTQMAKACQGDEEGFQAVTLGTGEEVDIFTATMGNFKIITPERMENNKSNVIDGNIGQFNVGDAKRTQGSSAAVPSPRAAYSVT